jgi:hypothetical protein
MRKDTMNKLNKRIRAAKKYKISQPPYIPYTKIEYISGKVHQMVEFPLTGPTKLEIFVAGMTVAGALFCLAYIFWRF